MQEMTLSDIIKACDGHFQGDESLLTAKVAGLARDHRHVAENIIFTAFHGERADGHDFIPAALEAGALCAMGERELPAAAPYIRVKDCARAWGDIARACRQRVDIPVIAVTGSVGKTTCKEMIAAVLEQKFRVLKSDGNHNNTLGLPLTLFRLGDEHEIAVLELGISDFGDMRNLAGIALPTAAVFTNIGDAHLEDLGDRAGVLRAKAELLEFLPAGGSVFINGDDELLREISVPPGITVTRFGLTAENDIFIDESKCEEGAEGTVCRLRDSEGRLEVFLPAQGRHLLYSVLAAAALGRKFGLTDSEIRAGLSGFSLLPGHGDLINTGHIKIIDHSYNASPVSVKAALDALTGMQGRKVAILGDMYGLGESVAEKHREVCRYMSKLPIWVLICVGELGKHFYSGALRYASAHDLYYYPSVEQAIKNLPAIVQAGDNVLVKASHDMGFGRIVEELKRLG